MRTYTVEFGTPGTAGEGEIRTVSSVTVKAAGGASAVFAAGVKAAAAGMGSDLEVKSVTRKPRNGDPYKIAMQRA